MFKKLIWLFFIATFLSGCATVKNPVSGETELTVMDERDEIAEGR